MTATECGVLWSHTHTHTSRESKVESTHTNQLTLHPSWGLAHTHSHTLSLTLAQAPLTLKGQPNRNGHQPLVVGLHIVPLELILATAGATLPPLSPNPHRHCKIVVSKSNSRIRSFHAYSRIFSPVILLAAQTARSTNTVHGMISAHESAVRVHFNSLTLPPLCRTFVTTHTDSFQPNPHTEYRRHV
jgi:hypothetical protein